MNESSQPPPAPVDSCDPYALRRMLIRRYWYLTLKFSNPLISDSGRYEASWNGGSAVGDTEAALLAKMLEAMNDCGSEGHTWITESEIRDPLNRDNALLTQHLECVFCDRRRQVISVYHPHPTTAEDQSERREGLALALLIIFGEPGDPRKWVTYANKITARIADGRYPHGQWLPPLAKISADLGAPENSYTQIRRALKEICAQELISFAVHAGYYVGDIEPEEEPQKELRHYAVRRMPAAIPGNQSDGRLLTPSEVAAVFRVDPNTVSAWADAGKLSSLRTLGGVRRYYASEVEHLRDNRRTGRKG